MKEETGKPDISHILRDRGPEFGDRCSVDAQIGSIFAEFVDPSHEAQVLFARPTGCSAAFGKTDAALGMTREARPRIMAMLRASFRLLGARDGIPWLCLPANGRGVVSTVLGLG